MVFVNRELKQQRRHRFKLYRSHSISFSSSSVGNLFGSWILTDCIEVQEKKSKVVVLCLPTSSTKREISQFLVVVVQWPQRNVQKSVMHVQSCCCANLNLLLFCRSRWRRRRRCLSSLMFDCYPPRHPFFCLTPSLISTQWSIPPKFATFETRRELSRVNFCKDFCARPQ